MGTKDRNGGYEDLRCTLGELLMEEDWMRDKYLKPYEKLDADRRNALYDKLQEEMHEHFGNMRKLAAGMRKQLKAVGGGVK